MKNKNRSTLKSLALLSLLWIGGTAIVSATVVPQDLYKEAELKENTARVPEEAIKLYEEYLKQPNIDRASQANALLHLGLCQSRIGQNESAKADWKKIIQEYSDQSVAYSAALSQLQMLQLSERVEVRASTPEVRIVYEPVPTRWELGFLNFNAMHSIAGRSRLEDNYSSGVTFNFDYFQKPGRLAWGLTGGLMSSSYQKDQHMDFLSPHVRFEKRTLGVLFPSVSVGPALYRFKESYTDKILTDSGYGYTYYADGDSHESTRWVGGVASEFDLGIGWTRGFQLKLGYSLHAMPNRGANGISLVGGPLVGLDFRW